MLDTEVEDLKIQILQVKRQNLKINNENDTLKVRLRKLEESMKMKHKLIDSLMNQDHPNNLRKAINDHGASMIIGLREENNKLREQLKERDMTIRKLRNEIGYATAYLADRSSFRKSSLRTLSAQPKSQSQLSYCSNNSSNVRRAASADRSRPKIQNKREVMVNRNKVSSSQRIEEKPHIEMRQLRTCFDDLISEMRNLKESIMGMQEKSSTTALQMNENPLTEGFSGDYAVYSGTNANSDTDDSVFGVESLTTPEK